MPKTPRVTAKALMNALMRGGFMVLRQRGSHVILKHADGRRTVVPMHGRDVPIGTLKGILQDIKMRENELRDLL